MTQIPQLITEHLDIWTSAETEKKSGRGRSSGNGDTVYGIKKLRELILELAVRGKLVPQDPKDEPASELLQRIQAEKARLVKEGKIKKEKALPDIVGEKKPFELPAGWVWVRIAEVSELITSGSRDWAKYLSDDGAIFVTMGNLSRGSYELRLESMRYVNPPRTGEGSRTKLEANDILISITGDVGNLGRIPEGFGEAYINQHTCLVRFLPLCRDRYIPEVLRSPLAQLQFNAPQRGIKNSFRLGDVDNILVPLPPLAEQHRIVAKVDEMMALCDQLETQHNNATDAHEKLVTHLLGTLTQSQNADDFAANWQRIAEHFDTLFTTEHSIDTLKQTLLQLAVMGKLVPQDPNDEPASELLKRIQAEKAKLIAAGKIKKEKPLPPISDEEKPFGLPKGWTWCRLGEICPGITSGSTPPQSEFIDKPGVPYLKVYNIKNQEIDFDYKPQFVSGEFSAQKLKRSVLYPGDVVMNIVGPPLGKIAIIPETFPEWNCNQAIVFFRPLVMALNRFIYTFLTAGTFLDDIELVGTAGQDNISVTKSQNIVMPTPPLAEQKRIVAKVGELILICDHLKSRITESSQLKQKLADALVTQALTA